MQELRLSDTTPAAMQVRNNKSGRIATAKESRGQWRIDGKPVTAEELEKNWSMVERAPAPMPQLKTVKVEAIEKRVDPKRNPSHLAKVRQLPCAKCGATAPSEAAHSNQMMWGKGKGTKANDLATFPMCRSCHTAHDTQRQADWVEQENRMIISTLLKIVS